MWREENPVLGDGFSWVLMVFDGFRWGFVCVFDVFLDVSWRNCFIKKMGFTENRF